MVSIVLFENACWQMYLNENQTYLGRGYVKLRRPCECLSDLTGYEWLQFGKMVAAYETATRKAFGATMFNWTCMMNSEYMKGLPAPKVHWHVRPRYKDLVEIGGVTYRDPNFGHHYDRDAEKSAPLATAELLVEIGEHLKGSFR